jgi:hypothetical protein
MTPESLQLRRAVESFSRGAEASGGGAAWRSPPWRAHGLMQGARRVAFIKSTRGGRRSESRRRRPLICRSERGSEGACRALHIAWKSASRVCVCVCVRVCGFEAREKCSERACFDVILSPKNVFFECIKTCAPECYSINRSQTARIEDYWKRKAQLAILTCGSGIGEPSLIRLTGDPKRVISCATVLEQL